MANRALVFLLAALSGCGTTAVQRDHWSPWQVGELARDPGDAQARAVLRGLLDDKEAAVRCMAVRALRTHLTCAPQADDTAILHELVPMLDDDAVSGMSEPGGLLALAVPIDNFVYLPSVRAEALVTLTTVVRRLRV